MCRRRGALATAWMVLALHIGDALVATAAPRIEVTPGVVEVVDLGTDTYIEETQSWDYFGRACAIDGEVAVATSVTDSRAQVYTTAVPGQPQGRWVAGAVLAPSGPEVYYGRSVSLAASGTAALVGSDNFVNEDSNRSGGGYLYFATDPDDPGGAWQPGAILATGFKGDLIGGTHSVALEGTRGGRMVAALGAKGHDYASLEAGFGVGVNLQNCGVVWVYMPVAEADPAGDWTMVGKLWADDAAAYANYYSDYFGDSVALSGPVLVVGAPSKHVGRGAAYVMVATDTDETFATWQQADKLLADDYVDDGHVENFGVAVPVQGTTAVIAKAKTALTNGGGGALWCGAACVVCCGALCALRPALA